MVDLKKIRMYYLISNIATIKNIKFFGGTLHIELLDGSNVSVTKIDNNMYSIHRDKINNYSIVRVKDSKELIAHIDELLCEKSMDTINYLFESI